MEAEFKNSVVRSGNGGQEDWEREVDEILSQTSASTKHASLSPPVVYGERAQPTSYGVAGGRALQAMGSGTHTGAAAPPPVGALQAAVDRHVVQTLLRQVDMLRAEHQQREQELERAERNRLQELERAERNRLQERKLWESEFEGLRSMIEQLARAVYDGQAVAMDTAPTQAAATAGAEGAGATDEGVDEAGESGEGQEDQDATDEATDQRPGRGVAWGAWNPILARDVSVNWEPDQPWDVGEEEKSSSRDPREPESWGGGQLHAPLLFVLRDLDRSEGRNSDRWLGPYIALVLSVNSCVVRLLGVWVGTAALHQTPWRP